MEPATQAEVINKMAVLKREVEALQGEVTVKGQLMNTHILYPRFKYKNELYHTILDLVSKQKPVPRYLIEGYLLGPPIKPVAPISPALLIRQPVGPNLGPPPKPFSNSQMKTWATPVKSVNRTANRPANKTTKRTCFGSMCNVAKSVRSSLLGSKKGGKKIKNTKNTKRTKRKTRQH